MSDWANETNWDEADLPLLEALRQFHSTMVRHAHATKRRRGLNIREISQMCREWLRSKNPKRGAVPPPAPIIPRDEVVAERYRRDAGLQPVYTDAELHEFARIINRVLLIRSTIDMQNRISPEYAEFIQLYNTLRPTVYLPPSFQIVINWIDNELKAVYAVTQDLNQVRESIESDLNIYFQWLQQERANPASEYDANEASRSTAQLFLTNLNVIHSTSVLEYFRQQLIARTIALRFPTQ